MTITRATPATLRAIEKWALLQTFHTLRQHYEDAAICECTWVLSAGALPVAYATALMQNSVRGVIHSAEVKEALHRQGYGRAIIEHTLADLWRQGANVVVLMSEANAAAFWVSMGFDLSKETFQGAPLLQMERPTA